MQIKKMLAVLVLPAVLASLLCSCGAKSNDKEIYFLNFKPESAEKYKEIASVYEKETGIKVKVSTAAANTYEQTLKSEVAKSNPPVIFQINGPVGYESWKNYCADLTDTSLYQLLADKSLAVTGPNGGVYGIPYVIEGYGIICNLAKLNEYFALDNRQTAVNSFEEINSFENLKTVVEDMTNHLSELSIRGVFGSTSLQSGDDWRWQTHLANIPFTLEADQHNYDIGKGVKEITFEYGPYMKNLFDLYLNNSVTDRRLVGSKSVADSMAEFALGQCAMIQNGNWAWSQIAKVAGNTVRSEDVRMLPLYTGAPGDDTIGLCVGTENYLCINKTVSTDKQKLADEFLTWLFSSDTGKAFVTEQLEFLTPFSSFSASETPDDPLAREINRWLNIDGKVSIPWNFVAFPSTDFKNDFGSALLRYAQESATWEDVTKTVIARWKEEAKGEK